MIYGEQRMTRELSTLAYYGRRKMFRARVFTNLRGDARLRFVKHLFMVYKGKCIYSQYKSRRYEVSCRNSIKMKNKLDLFFFCLFIQYLKFLLNLTN